MTPFESLFPNSSYIPRSIPISYCLRDAERPLIITIKRRNLEVPTFIGVSEIDSYTIRIRDADFLSLTNKANKHSYNQ